MGALKTVVTGGKYVGKNIGSVGKTIIGTYIGWNVLIKGVDGAAVSMLSDDAQKKLQDHGLVGLVSGAAFGKGAEKRSVVNNVSSTIVGSQTTERVGEFINNIPENAEGMYNGAVKNVREAYQNYQEGQVQQLQQQQPQQSQAVVPYPQGAMYGSPSLLGGMDQAIENMTGGRMDTMSTAQMMLAAYMMFTSRFGFLGKIGGALLGHNAFQGMGQRQAHQQAMQYQVQPAVATVPAQVSVTNQNQEPEQNQAAVVSRHR